MTREEAEAIEITKEFQGTHILSTNLSKALDIVIKALEQKPQTGHWIIYVISMIDGEGCRCSECGTEGVPYWDYCPNCGAKMEIDQ